MEGFDFENFMQTVFRLLDEDDITDAYRLAVENYEVATGHCYGWTCSCFVEGFAFEDLRLPRRRRDC